MRDKIPFYLVTGFLGSGKTTLLKKILDYYGDELKMAIVQNEFAPASVDGIDLKRSGKPMELLEVNNGSVFCVCLLDHFIVQLSEFLAKIGPDMLIMEASGLSDPIGIAEMLQKGDVSQKIQLAGIWCILDAVNCLKVIKMNRQLRNQVMIADDLLINKCDLADEGQLKKVESTIRQWNPFARIHRVTFCDIRPELLEKSGDTEPIALKVSATHGAAIPVTRPDIRVGVMKSGRQISAEALRQLLNRYAQSTYRIKGFVNLNNGKHITVQTSFQHIALHDLPDYSGPTQLIALGEDFDLKAFARSYRALSE